MTKKIDDTIKNCSNCRHNTLWGACVPKYTCEKHTHAIKLPLIYVLGEPDENHEPENYQQFITQRAANAGVLPINGRLYFATFVSQRPMLKELDEALLAKCDAVWVFGNVVIESLTEEALRLGKHVYYIDYNKTLPNNPVIDAIIADIKILHWQNQSTNDVRMLCSRDNKNTESVIIEHCVTDTGKIETCQIGETKTHNLANMTAVERAFLSSYIQANMQCDETRLENEVEFA